MQTICKIIEIKHQKVTGKSITLNHNTLQNLANGDHLKANFNATKAWLMQAEEKNIVGIVKNHTSEAGETLQTRDDGQPLAQNCIWAIDKTSFQPSGGARETMIDAVGKKNSVSAMRWYSHHPVHCTGKFPVDFKVSLIHLSSSKVCHNINNMFKNVHYNFRVIPY